MVFIPTTMPVTDLHRLEEELIFLTMELGVKELVIIGGQSLYELFLPVADSL